MIGRGKVHRDSIVCLFVFSLKLPVEYLFDIFHLGKLNLSVFLKEPF